MLETHRPCCNQSIVEKIFGRNLDEFLATRIAAFVNVVFLVVSICECRRCRRSIGALGGQLDGGGGGARPDRRGGRLGARSGRHLPLGLFTIATICSAIGYSGGTCGTRRHCAFALSHLPSAEKPGAAIHQRLRATCGLLHAVRVGNRLLYRVRTGTGNRSGWVARSWSMQARPGNRAVGGERRHNSRGSCAILRLQFGLRHLDQWNRAVTRHHSRAEQFRRPRRRRC